MPATPSMAVAYTGNGYGRYGTRAVRTEAQDAPPRPLRAPLHQLHTPNFRVVCVIALVLLQMYYHVACAALVSPLRKVGMQIPRLPSPSPSTTGAYTP